MKFFTQIDYRLTKTAQSADVPFAVFVVTKAGDGYAATTRAADRGESGRIGLPGGKVDPGEDPVRALVRECAEEGWAVEGVAPAPEHVADVEGKPVWWYRASSASMLDDFKEKGRIEPVVKSLDEIAASGYGNEWLRGTDDIDAVTAKFLESDERLRKSRQAALAKFDAVAAELAKIPDGWEKSYAAGKLAEWKRRFEYGENPRISKSPYDYMPIYLDEMKNIHGKRMANLLDSLEIVVDGVRKIVEDPSVRYSEDPPPPASLPKPPVANESPESGPPNIVYEGGR
jgi:ADP-ribose pyrophosphatase YjhB (NUDIX family)